MSKLTRSEAEGFLDAINTGKVRLVPNVEPQAHYCGDVHYLADNGWTITVFNDCNQWDYIDRIVANDGRTITFEEMEEWGRVRFQPSLSEEMAWQRYRIPGYMKYRCTACGVEIQGGRHRGEFLCEVHKPSGVDG